MNRSCSANIKAKRECRKFIFVLFDFINICNIFILCSYIIICLCSVMFTNQIGRIPLDWALGAFIVKLREEGFTESSTDMIEDYKTIFSFVSISLVIGLLVLIFYWWRRPSMKTIYDLEKGRYITTVTRNLNKFWAFTWPWHTHNYLIHFLINVFLLMCMSNCK